MSDDFDEIIAANELGADFGAAASAGVLSPDKCDDHIALHVLEGTLQVAAMLDCLDFAAPYVSEPSFALVAEFGLNAWMDAIFPDGLSVETPNFGAWMLAVRSMAGDLALACEAYLRAHDLPGITFMVHLSNHGWYPMHISGTVNRSEGLV